MPPMKAPIHVRFFLRLLAFAGMWSAVLSACDGSGSRTRPAESSALAVADKGEASQDADARIPRDDIPGLPPYRPMAGMTIADNFPDYATDQALVLCDTLKKRGVTWVAVTPCGAMSSITSRNVFWSRWAERDYVGAIRRMRSHGVRVLLKPYIWCNEFWTHKKWTGDIRFADSSDRAAWFESYTQFMMDNARYARDGGADMLCIGLELPQLTPYEDEWRALIDSIRIIYTGPLTYAAHGTEEADRIAFWDKLQFVGINLYPNLSGDVDPDDASLRNGWGPIIKNCARIAEQHQREIILTEAGFRSVVAAAHKPWEWPEHEERPVSMSHQSQAYRILADELYPQPWFAGIFWWKVFTNQSAGGPRDDTFTPQGKPAFDDLQRGFARLHGMFVNGRRVPAVRLEN